MKKDVTKYVQGCTECQRHKVNTRPTRATLALIFPKEGATAFDVIAANFITKLPVSSGYDCHDPTVRLQFGCLFLFIYTSIHTIHPHDPLTHTNYLVDPL
jgi:hypothetical protein